MYFVSGRLRLFSTVARSCRRAGGKTCTRLKTTFVDGCPDNPVYNKPVSDRSPGNKHAVSLVVVVSVGGPCPTGFVRDSGRCGWWDVIPGKFFLNCTQNNELTKCCCYYKLPWKNKPFSPLPLKLSGQFPALWWSRRY